MAWTIPDVPDDQLARLPWSLSQQAFGSAGPLRTTRRSARAGWHGTSVDPEEGANCIVRSDGLLADLVGERLRVTYRVGTKERVIFVYCHDEQDFPEEAADEDVSLTRAGFRRLAPLALDGITVTIQVLA